MVKHTHGDMGLQVVQVEEAMDKHRCLVCGGRASPGSQGLPHLVSVLPAPLSPVIWEAEGFSSTTGSRLSIQSTLPVPKANISLGWADELVVFYGAVHAIKYPPAARLPGWPAQHRPASSGGTLMWRWRTRGVAGRKCRCHRDPPPV